MTPGLRSRFCRCVSGLGRARGAVLVVITADLEPVASAEHHQLTVTYRSPLGTHAPSASKNVDERVKGLIPRRLQSRPAKRSHGSA